MPSAFRRAGAKNASAKGGSVGSKPSLIGLPGIRPWTGGIHRTSMGLNDLDTILGGGQPLGTCILLQEDRWARDLAHSLVKYWLAEGLSQGQEIIIPVAEKGDFHEDDFLANLEEDQVSFAYEEEVVEFVKSLPRNLHWDKQKRRQERQAALEVPKSLDILEEEEEDEDKAEEGLEIAWQYKKSVQQERLGLDAQSNSPSTISSSNIFCHSYDLSGRLIDQQEDLVINVLEDKRPKATVASQGITFFQRLISYFETKAGKAIRLFLHHPDLDVLSVALPLLLAYIRKENLPIVVLVCVAPQTNLKAWLQISRASDVVLSTEGFASRQEYPPPPEFRHLQGLLKISKLSTVAAATANGGGHFGDLTISKRPAAFIYGFKRDRRKLHIQLLHIPPEDYAEGGGSVGSGVRSGGGRPAEKKSSGGGMGCASNMAGSKLDF